MSAWGHLRRAVVFATAGAAALLLAGSARPVATGAGAAGPVTITKTAPSTAVAGWFDYTITLSYTGTLTDVSPEYTVTDPLPPEVKFISVSITAGTCTQPPPGQAGTVACTVRFAPGTMTTTAKITVEASHVGTVTNTAQLATGETASATTTIVPPPPGTFSVTQAGPSTITLPHDAAPPRFGYTIDVAYAGPALTKQIATRFTDSFPALVKNPGIAEGAQGAISNCSFPPTDTAGATLSCDLSFDPSHLTAHFVLMFRPTGKTGRGTNTFSLDNGDSASWTTTFVAAPPPPPPPVAGPAAAPAETVTETFTDSGQTEAEAVAIAPTAETAQVVVTWGDPDAALDLTGFQLVSGGTAVTAGRSLAAAGRRKPRALRLKVTKKRTARSVEARVTNLKRGKLRFRVVAKKVGTKTKARVVVRQSKKRVPR